MTNAFVKTLQGLLCAAAIAACVFAAGARAQVHVEPPPEVIATLSPVYFEGRPAYWWGGRWYYRNGSAWGYYHDEPGYLRDWRGHHEPARAYYGRGHFGGYRRR
jgi:hypothetical protein